MRKIYYRDAVREALDEEMARDPMVMMIGEDIGVGDGTWRCSKGLYEKYGDLRMKDSPISESGIVGMGIGMALTGMRPIVEIMFSDFMLVAMDQIVNQMAKVCYMSGGQKNVPMVIRTTIGAGRPPRPALPESERGHRPLPRLQDRHPVRCLYRQGPAEICHPGQ